MRLKKEDRRQEERENVGENTEMHTKKDTRKLCSAALGSLVKHPPFFLQLEVNRSVTDSRELLRRFVRGRGQSLLSQGPSEHRIYRI